MSTVTDLERKVQSLESQLSEAKGSLYFARLAEKQLVPEKTVLMHKAEKFLFVSARFFGTSSWINARKQKKDGSWGERVICLYDEWVRMS
jgi:hypothetical protein